MRKEIKNVIPKGRFRVFFLVTGFAVTCQLLAIPFAGTLGVPGIVPRCYGVQAGRVQTSVPSPEKVKAGRTIAFQVLVVNEGAEDWETGAYTSIIDIYDAQKRYKTTTETLGKDESAGVMVNPGDSALFFFSFDVPPDYRGEYFYKVHLKYEERTISTSDYYTFSVIPLSRGATIKIINEIGAQEPGSSFKVKCEVRNKGEEREVFPVELKLKTPDKLISLPGKTVSIDPGKSSVLEFNYVMPGDSPEGTYLLTASVYDNLKKGSPEGKYDEVTKKFTLIVDMPPTVQLLNLELSAVKGEEISLKVRVVDDKGVNSVKIKYRFPGMIGKKMQDMVNISGNKKDGVWMFKIAAFSETGEFIFSIEATDKKLQTSRSEYRVSVIAE